MPGPLKDKLPAKVCEGCGKEYEQRDAESPSRFRSRKFCGTECRQVAQRVDRSVAKQCEGCGKSFHCREDEVGWRFKQRRSCSADCAVALRKGKRYGDPTYSTSRKRKSEPAPIRLVTREQQVAPQEGAYVRWVPAPEPKIRYAPTVGREQPENLTQAERVARRARFGQTFRRAS